VAWRDFRNDPAGDLFQIYGENVNADGTLGGTVVAAQASLISSDVSGRHVALRWAASSRQVRYGAERRGADGIWQTIAQDLWSNGSDEVSLEDNVPAAGTYSYRLVWQQGDARITGPIADVRVEASFGMGLVALRDVGGRRVGVRYAVPPGTAVRLEVFDTAGRRVRRFREARGEAGEHSLWWDERDDRGAKVARGLYLARLSAGGTTLSAKLVSFGD
jgi:hypothetical protein